MNLLLLFAAVAAVASIVGLLKSSLRWRWQAVLSFGMIVATATVIALLLDHFTPLTSFEWAGERTATGLPLYLPGPSASILGRGYGFVFIAFLWSIGLIAAAFIMKRRKVSSITESEMDGEELTEAEYIHKRLMKAIDEERENFDPAQAGEDDATRDGGPFPQENDVEPQGYESGVRTRFETLGSNFLSGAVTRLRTELTNALTRLGRIQKEISEQSYKQIARAHYDENRTEVAPHIVRRNQRAYTKTKQERMAFVNSLHELGEAGQPDWAKDDRTTLEALIVWGVAFALIEFAVSWFFLKSQIGESAIQIAGYAVIIIFSLAFLAGFSFRFMRHNQPPHVRVPAVAGYVCICFGIFLGLGLLLNFREFRVNDDWVSSIFGAISSGYNSLASDLTNLVIFLVNLVALAAFYWKVLYFFDKFHDYSQVNRPFLLAEESWERMYDKAQEKIINALEYASGKAITSSKEAEVLFDSIQRKKEALESIRDIITSAHQHTLLAYREDIQKYRESNLESRALAVNPAPSFFGDQPPFCDVERYLLQADDVETFLSENREKLEQAGENLGAIAEGKTRWQTDRPILLSELTSEFERMISAARRTGTATEPSLS